MKIEKFDLDAAGKPCSEGYYVHDGSRLLLMPPTGEMCPEGMSGKISTRLATREEVDRGGAIPATEAHIANAGPQAAAPPPVASVP